MSEWRLIGRAYAVATTGGRRRQPGFGSLEPSLDVGLGVRAEDGVKEATTAAGRVHAALEGGQVSLVVDPAQQVSPRRRDAVLEAELRAGQALEADRPGATGSVRAALRVRVKILLKRHDYPPDKEAAATALVLEQAQLVTEEMLAA
jgi:Domain of unknown function (DUF3387)